MRASRTTAGMKTRNIRPKHPRRGVLPGRSARQRRQKRSSQQEKHEPRRRYSCDCTGIAPPFFVVSTAFSRRQDGESYPCAAENRLQRRAGRACAGLRREAGQASGRRQKGAGWARSSLCAVQRGRGRLRPSAARSAEAPNRRAPSPTPCKQTPSMKGAGNADIGEAVEFFILRCTFIKKIAREIGRKTDQDASG